MRSLCAQWEGRKFMKRGAIFDMDGTLLDTERLYSLGWVEVAADFGKEKQPDLSWRACGLGNDQCVALVKEYYPDLDGQEYVRHVVEFVKKKIEKELSLMPGVPEVLRFFEEQGIRMAVASSTETDIVEANLRRTDIRRYFQAVVGGDQVTNGKPAPDIFLRAADLLGIPAGDCYVFEDSPNGIRAAAAAGCAAVMVPDQIRPTEEIRDLSADVCENMADVLKKLRGGML